MNDNPETTFTKNLTAELPWSKYRAYLASSHSATITLGEDKTLTFPIEQLCDGTSYYRSNSGTLYKLIEKNWGKVSRVIIEEWSKDILTKKVEKSS